MNTGETVEYPIPKNENRWGYYQLQHNEYIVYDTNQIRMRYLVQVKLVGHRRKQEDKPVRTRRKFGVARRHPNEEADGDDSSPKASFGGRGRGGKGLGKGRGKARKY